MIGSPRLRYVVDVYHQPPGYSQPMVKEQHRIMARSDADGISEAQTIFAGRDAPLVTGFALRSIGSRRFGDQTIYRHDKAADAPSIKYATDLSGAELGEGARVPARRQPSSQGPPSAPATAMGRGNAVGSAVERAYQRGELLADPPYTPTG
jgi:hypothetical protein